MKILLPTSSDHCQVPTAHCSQPTSSFASRLLWVRHRLPPTTYRLSSIRHCLPSTAYCLLIVLTLIGTPACKSDGEWADLWLTRDQQGRHYFEQGQYAEAAAAFENPLWKGIACYRAEDWDCAIDQFARLETAESYFNLGNACANRENYELAIEAYDQALSKRPDWTEALENQALVTSRIAEEPPPPEEGQGDPTFAPDEIKFDEKGEKGEKGEVDQAFFTDEQLAEMWLRGVQSTPADFLRMKFAYQAAEDTAQEKKP